MNVDVNQERLTRGSCELSAPASNQTVTSNVSVTFVALKMCSFLFFFVTVCEITCLKI